MHYTLSDCIAALTTALGAPVSTDNDDGAKWGSTDAERPSAYIGDGDGECVVVDLYPKGVTTQTRIYVAESIRDLAGIVVRGGCPKHGVILPLADAVAAARIAMGRDRMPLMIVRVEATEALGFPTESGDNRAAWESGVRTVEMTLESDGVVRFSFFDADSRSNDVDHVIAETTDTPAVIDCRTVTDALYRSGACTLAVALKAARSCLANGLPADAVIR